MYICKYMIMVLSTGLKYADWIPWRGQRSPTTQKESPVYDTKTVIDGDDLVLEIWRMSIALWLPLLCPRVIVPVRVTSISQIDLFENSYSIQILLVI